MLCEAMLGLMNDLAFAVVNLYFSHHNTFTLFVILHWHGKSSESSKLNISHIEIVTLEILLTLIEGMKRESL